MTTGLFVGRFQPFHNAHLIDIKNAITEVDKLIILIGSSQYKHAPENPFTVEERVLMVQVALHSENIKNCSIFSLEDINDDSKWVDYVSSNIPKFDIIFSGNPRVIRLFREKNIPVRKVKHIRNISGTLIRERMNLSMEWKIDMPLDVIKLIENIDGINRVKRLFRETGLREPKLH